MAMRKGKFAIYALYDGECLTCGQQIGFLRERDVNGCIRFIEITASGFDVERDAGIPIVRAIDCIQARLASGEVVQGVQAIRLLREAAGLTPSAKVTTRLPSISRIREVLYRLIDKNRLPRDVVKDRAVSRGIGFEVNLDVDFLECRKVSGQVAVQRRRDGPPYNVHSGSD